MKVIIPNVRGINIFVFFIYRYVCYSKQSLIVGESILVTYKGEIKVFMKNRTLLYKFMVMHFSNIASNIFQ